MLLLTNDDGIDAPGLAALLHAVHSHDHLIVAPRREMSECSHCVTTKRPLLIEQHGPRRYTVDGTPADCVRVAILHLLPELGIDVRRNNVRVLSGINAGGNLGADIYISGTVAAAREAAFFGLEAVALSQYRRAVPAEREWRQAAAWARDVLDILEPQRLNVGEFWNVNFPWREPHDHRQPPAIEFCERSRRPLPVKYDRTAEGLSYVRDRYHLREFEPGSDIDICFGGDIAISRIAI
ncbi:MAG TPA: 5'/3'-nucleotidase SurE [Phycisphaerae bacterium]|nr:5'/3'-nucleotidase SurE [Phycisphaerae bacterium]